MTYLGICQIGCIWNARFLTVKCISFSLMHLISFAKFTSGQPHLSNCHLSNQMLLAFQMNCNWCKLYASGQDPQFDINFARAVHFDFGRMRLRTIPNEQGAGSLKNIWNVCILKFGFGTIRNTTFVMYYVVFTVHHLLYASNVTT